MIALDKPHRVIMLGLGPRGQFWGGVLSMALAFVLLRALKPWNQQGALVITFVVAGALLYAFFAWGRARLSISDSVLLIHADGRLSAPIRLMRSDIVECVASVRRPGPTKAKFLLSPVLCMAFATKDTQYHLRPYTMRPQHLPGIQKVIEELGGRWEESIY